MNTIEINRTKENTKEKTYKLGQMFLNDNDELVILAQVDEGKIALIYISEGNRYDDPVKVSNILCITYSEAKQCSSFFDSFTPVDTKITVTL